MDPQQQYCLKWNSFGNNLANTFASLFRSESLTDVTLFCEGTIFKAHKLILAACSKRFQEIFETSPSSSGGAMIVYLDRTSASDMEALLEFMYRGEVHVSQESLNTFLSAADNLQVKGLSMEQSKLAAQREQDEPNNNNNNNNNSSNNSDNGGSPPGGGGGGGGGSGPSGGGGGNGPANGGGGSHHQAPGHQQNQQQQPPYTGSHHHQQQQQQQQQHHNNGNVPNGHLHHNGSASTSGHSTRSSSSPSDSNNEHVAESPENKLKRKASTPDPPSPAPASYPKSPIFPTYYDSQQKRLMRSPNDIEGTSLGNRASVLRDNPAFRPDSAPHSLILENHLFQPYGLHADTPTTHPQTAPHTPTELERELKRECSEERERNADHKDGVAEDLRIKQEPDERERLNGISSTRRSDGLYGSAQRNSSSSSSCYEGAVAALPCSSSSSASLSLQHGYVNSSHVELPSTSSSSSTSHHLQQHHQQHQQLQQQQQQLQQQQQQQLSSPPLSTSSLPPALPSSSPTSSSQSPLSPSMPSTSRGRTGKSPPNGRGGGTGPGRTPKFAASRTTPDLSPTDPTSPVSWSSTAKLNKKLTYVTAPDGRKKLKCPHCERLYGYETNLRAHIRQRHQGIRVHCPFCSRTFTRNNTVRRHIAREHMRDGNGNNSSNPSGPGRPSSAAGATDSIDKQ